jgi:hypothetical protein
MTSATRAEQGWQMLDIFASFGVRAFDLTETDLDGRRRSFRPSQEWKLLGRWRASLLESAAARQDNIIVRPGAARSNWSNWTIFAAPGWSAYGASLF